MSDKQSPPQCGRGHCLHSAGWVGIKDYYYAALRRCCWCDFQMLVTTEIRLQHGPMLEKKENA